MLTPIGTTNHRNRQTLFGIKEKDRSGHIYCIGKTGTGKSTLLLNMALGDIIQGRGVAILDPHGDLCLTILDYIPKDRIKDVIYLNPSDMGSLIAYNPLYNVKEENRYQVASNIVSVFKKLWSESWGPRLEHILRNAIYSLTFYPHATLLDISPLITDTNFRFQVLHFVENDTLQNFWQKEFNTLSPQQRNEHIAPILNKVGILATHPIIRSIIGNTVTSFEVSKVMDESKILLVNLSKGILGESGTQFLGSLLVTQFQTASLERAKRNIEDRTPFYLYIDEMHSFVTLSFADILSESRKYGLSLFLTHQFLDQLHEDIRKAIFGNVGTLITFRIGTEDAERIEHEFYPTFTKDDLSMLPQYSIYLKLLIDGTISQPFSATTLPLQYPLTYNKQQVIAYSRKRYGSGMEIKRYVQPLVKEQQKSLF
ncbi:MAG: type IV secretion system DNA-binding domain-containing protein [Chitinophagaceae bacterium]|nr:type IV secretion system DNA-binding domain-containing protein [Chitinophagaceae bacterium]